MPLYRLSLLAIVVALGGCSSSGSMTSEPPADMVASVGDTFILWPQLQAEFERAAGMSDAQPEATVSAYEDFLERYVDYRLKVLEAESIGLDDDPAIRDEIDGYRRQYARPYLLDRTVLLPVMRALYERQQEAVDVSHVLLSVPNGASPADTLALYNEAAAIADSARAGVDFGELARRHSTDPSATDERRGPGYAGRLGFITGGTTVRPFEDAAWSTGVGMVSDPVRTTYGYHVVKVHARQPTPANIRIAHIMITPRGGSAADSAAALARVDSVVTQLDGGADFAALAATYSSDRQSADRGGELGELSFGTRFIQVMKDAAFALEDVGDVSDPVLTEYGYHLIKLLGRSEHPTFDESFDALKQQASRLPVAASRQEAFADSILVARGATVDSAVIADHLSAYSADSLAGLSVYPAEWDTLAVATLQDSSYTLAMLVRQAPWSRYARTVNVSAAEVVDMTTDAFMRDKAISYETYVLESRDPEFARTVREFRNGILLFNLMEDSVWTAASTDSAAILALYNENPAKYSYPSRTVVVSAYARSKDIVEKAAALLRSGLDPAATTDSLNSHGVLTIDTTRVAGPSNSVYDRALASAEGTFSSPLAHNQGFISVARIGVEPPRPKTFEESRAELVSELQSRLEERLVARLRDKYDANTYPDRLRAMLGEEPVTTATP